MIFLKLKLYNAHHAQIFIFISIDLALYIGRFSSIRNNKWQDLMNTFLVTLWFLQIFFLWNLGTWDIFCNLRSLELSHEVIVEITNNWVETCEKGKLCLEKEKKWEQREDWKKNKNQTIQQKHMIWKGLRMILCIWFVKSM